jgi:hypothetical protein
VAALKLVLVLVPRELIASRELEDWCEYVCVRAGCVAVGGDGFSKSEQYAESRPREGGVLSDCSRSRCALTAAETERTRWRGPQYPSSSNCLISGCFTSECFWGGGSFRTCWISFRFREKRCRSEDRLLTSGAGAASWTEAAGGFGEGTGVYVCGFRMKSDSGSTSEEER